MTKIRYKVCITDNKVLAAYSVGIIKSLQHPVKFRAEVNIENSQYVVLAVANMLAGDTQSDIALALSQQLIFKNLDISKEFRAQIDDSFSALMADILFASSGYPSLPEKTQIKP